MANEFVARHGLIARKASIISESLNVSGSVTAASYTGSLFGTASWALNAINTNTSLTASYVETARTASYVVTALTASYVDTARTASYVVTALTASYVDLARTASYVSIAQTASYFNGRIIRRTGTTASTATPNINTDNVEYYSITNLSTAISAFTLSGTPNPGQTLWISIQDNGTARALTWGSGVQASTISLPTTTVISTRLDVGLVWNESGSIWRLVATA